MTSGSQFFDVVIVGGGHGGAQVALALRQQKFEGSIAVVGDEPVPPYERPPLSKDYMAGEKSFERILLRPEKFWGEKNVDLLLGQSVISVDPDARNVTLADGRRVGYRDLVWSAGGSPRRLTCDGADLAGVHAVRDKADADRIITELQGGARKVVVVGGGYIGLEAAAVLTKLGCEVVLLEACDRVLARVAGEELSRFYEKEHRANGVDLRCGVTVNCLEGDGMKVTGVRLGDGTLLSCDMAIVGIGIVPTVGPLAEAGAEVSNGVQVNSLCRTSLPHVYAVGDCAMHANSYAGGEMIRLESVQNANDMATTAAKAICGNEEPYQSLPWFWSNQYDLKLQTAGLSSGHDTAVLRGNPEDRSFSIVYLRDGKVVALDCVNATRDYVQGRKLVEAGTRVAPDLLADCDTPLKEIQRLIEIGTLGVEDRSALSKRMN